MSRTDVEPGGRLERLLNLNGGWEKVLSLGLRLFIKEQDPENVEFRVYRDGWSIVVKTDEEGVEQAEDFWDQHLGGKL